MSHRHILLYAKAEDMYVAGRQEFRTIEFYKQKGKTIEFKEPSSAHRLPSLICFLKVPAHLYQ